MAVNDRKLYLYNPDIELPEGVTNIGGVINVLGSNTTLIKINLIHKN